MDKYSKQIIEMTDEVKTAGELYEMLSSIAFTIGGLICHFPQDERSQVFMQLTKSMGFGFQTTAKNIGEPSDMEIIVGAEEV